MTRATSNFTIQDGGAPAASRSVPPEAYDERPGTHHPTPGIGGFATRARPPRGADARPAGPMRSAGGRAGRRVPHAPGGSEPDSRSVAEPEPDALLAEHAWRSGDPITAVDAADRALSAGADRHRRAAGVAAAIAAADGGLRDAAARWRAVAAGCEGATAVQASGRAALTAGLAGDVVGAGRDLAEARRMTADHPPRGVAVLLDGGDAVLDAMRGNLVHARRRLAGLAAATVPPDWLTVERWAELAVMVTAAAGEPSTARAMLGGVPAPPGARHGLLAAWLDLRAGRLDDARQGLAAAAPNPVLRRDAMLAAAVAVGLARRSGNDHALAAAWHRAAPVINGADVEPLLLDV
ncbi:MAG: hypothetical protein L0I76_08785, partial [Pseudonocardia sp.]|nr:hypothetical protein [Pseudonocardia sp.]